MKNSDVFNEDISQELNNLIEKISAKIQVKKIILFGSYAYGNPDKDSDIDLCVITEDQRRKIEILWDIQEAIYKASKHPVDVIVSKPDEFIDRADSVSTMEKTIADKGVVIYG
jgi:predicted nucleotidyltransferase